MASILGQPPSVILIALEPQFMPLYLETSTEKFMDKTRLIHALRPFSLIVALATCGLGVSLALLDGQPAGLLLWLVPVTGILLQIAVNLLNDHADVNRSSFTAVQRQRIHRNTQLGWLVMAVAVLLGIYMVSIRGWPLLVLGVIGVLGAWGYTGGRVNYKDRGLGVILVFLLMGVMLVGGAYYTISGRYSFEIFLLSLPFSLLSSLLLLSNELRDYESDLAGGIRTLTVRWGYACGVRLYFSLCAAVYLVCALLFWQGLLPGLLLVMLTVLALWAPIRHLSLNRRQRIALTPLTGRFYLVFGIAYLATLWLQLP